MDMLGLRFGYPKLGHNGKLITLSWNCLRNSRCVPQKGRERDSGFRKPTTHFSQPRYVVQPEKLCERASGCASALQSQPPQGWPAQLAAHVPTGCQLHGARARIGPAAPRGISPWQGWSRHHPLSLTDPACWKRQGCTLTISCFCGVFVLSYSLLLPAWVSPGSESPPGTDSQSFS